MMAYPLIHAGSHLAQCGPNHAVAWLREVPYENDSRLLWRDQTPALINAGVSPREGGNKCCMQMGPRSVRTER